MKHRPFRGSGRYTTHAVEDQCALTVNKHSCDRTCGMRHAQLKLSRISLYFVYPKCPAKPGGSVDDARG